MTENKSLSQGKGYMTRRRALKGLVALAGGTASGGDLLPLVHAALAESEKTPVFLNMDQFALLGRIADLMIPATDTPGAYAAGVHRFIDMMLLEFAAESTRQQLLAGLDEVNAASVARQASDFVDLSAEDQFEILAGVDERAFLDSSRSEPYRLLKSMILFGYYTSEPGASVELLFNPIPGTTPGCVPADSFDRAPFKSL
jgi:hypothetical protein